MTQAAVPRPRWHFGVPVVINFSSVLLTFAARMLLARFLGPAAFGMFAVWQNNIQLFGTLGTVGQANYVIRETTRAKHPRSDLARDVALAAVVLTVIGGSLFGIAGAIVFRFLQGGDFFQTSLQWSSTILFALMVTLSAVHRGLGSLIIGILFDRLVSQILFLAFLLIAGGAILGGTLGAMIAFTLTLAISAIMSLFYLLKVLGPEALVSAARIKLARHGVQVLPFFFVNSLFVVNARYLLSYAGIFVEGDVLGEIGLVFTVVAMMVIPTSTLNLIVAPYLAKRLRLPAARRVTLMYLSSIAALAFVGVVVVAVAHPLIFRLAAMTQTISWESILLLSSAFALTLLGNAAVTVLQFRECAVDAAKLFGLATGAKLALGYLAAAQMGLIALFWTDLVIGLIFVGAALAKSLGPAPQR